VDALQVHPHKHCANYPPRKVRGFARDAWRDIRTQETRRQRPRVTATHVQPKI